MALEFRERTLPVVSILDSDRALPRLPSLVGIAVARMLAPLRFGHLLIGTPDGRRIEVKAPGAGPRAVIEVRRWRAIARMLLKGDIGFAEAYMEGDWTTPDLGAVIELGARNLDAFGRAFRGSRTMRAARRLHHMLHANTRRGSKRNIAQHYDLGNAFYRAWLDTGMTYSSALYSAAEQTLEQAQEAKLDRVVSLLDLAGAEKILEIGCGWGRLAEKIAATHDGSFVGITLSPSQLAYGRDRLERAALSERATLELQDYRECAGRYDRIVSIEMLEAVGERYWPRFFKKISTCLKPGGCAILQVITIAPEQFASYSADQDFIQRYIFPGGMLPTCEIIRQHAEGNGLRIEAVEYFGQSYARTLAEWRARFCGACPTIKALGYSARFRRMWEYYLAYCEAGFRTGSLDVGLYRLTLKEEATRAER